MICNTVTAISNVLLATDFSEESVQAVDWARGVSRMVWGKAACSPCDGFVSILAENGFRSKHEN
jgi:hypothetical protein